MWLLWGYFKDLPEKIEEAAFVDGATRFQAFYKIVLPTSLPGLVATSIFVFLRSWNDYTFALMLIQSDSKKTLPLGTSYFFQAHNINWDLVLAAAVVISLPVFVLFIFTQKYLIKGIAAGALSGQ
jgi:ABC-type glycerol-3-phosphate transport system permease component